MKKNTRENSHDHGNQKEFLSPSDILKDVISKHSNQINSFSTGKRTEIEWLNLGVSSQITVEFCDRKQFDRKEDKLLLFKNINIPTIKVKDASFECHTAYLYSFRSMARTEESGSPRMIELKAKNLSFSFDSYGDCLVQHIRFKETSFHHHGDSFQLSVILTDSSNSLITAFISSPFLVESRKKPFQERAHKEQNISTLYDPFLPSIIDKQYNCNGNQVDTAEGSNVIGEDLRSLIIYFSAQNIRHKIIHPLYLLFKFPKAISLFYNKNIIQQENITPENLIISIQKNIFETLLNNNDPNNNKDLPYSRSMQQQERLLILGLKTNGQSSTMNKDLCKVSRYMSFLEGPTLTFLEKLPKDLPAEFKLINNIEDMKAAYSKVYCQISQIKIEIKMSQDINQRHLHSIVERRGGVPSKESVGVNNHKTPFGFNATPDTPKTSTYKNSFHYICYDLSIKDEQTKTKLTKIPINMNPHPSNQLFDKKMDLEIDQSISNHITNKGDQSNASRMQKQNSRSSNWNEDDHENSLQLNSIRKEIDNFNENNSLESNSNKSSNSSTKRVAAFRIKKDYESQVKVITSSTIPLLKGSQITIPSTVDASKDQDTYSHLTKRKISLLFNDNQQQKNNQVDPKNKSEHVLMLDSKKKRKLQNISYLQSRDHNNNNLEKIQKMIKPSTVSIKLQSGFKQLATREFNIEKEQRLISGKIENLHLSQQQQYKQNMEIEKKDFQGNTSSTASTVNNINKGDKKIDHSHVNNILNNSSSSSQSRMNKDTNSLHYNHKRKRNGNVTQSSSSDSQNFKGTFEVTQLTQNKHQHQQQQNEIICEDSNNMKDHHEHMQSEKLHLSHQSKMEVELLYEKLSRDSNEIKKNIKQSKSSNNQSSLQIGYESDYSESDDKEDESERTNQLKQETSFKLEQYLKGYDNDEEFDYNIDDDDELSLESSNRALKVSPQHRRNNFFSNSQIPSQTSFQNKIPCNSSYLITHKTQNKVKTNQSKSKPNQLKSQLKNYQSYNEIKSISDDI